MNNNNSEAQIQTSENNDNKTDIGIPITEPIIDEVK